MTNLASGTPNHHAQRILILSRKRDKSPKALNMKKIIKKKKSMILSDLMIEISSMISFSIEAFAESATIGIFLKLNKIIP